MNREKLLRGIFMALSVALITAIGSYLLHIDRVQMLKKGYTETTLQGGTPLSGFTDEAEKISKEEPKQNVVTGRVNLNSATSEELQTLPGIGKVLAQRIITYREKTPFKVIYDLKKISGIGNKTFQSLSDLICVE